MRSNYFLSPSSLIAATLFGSATLTAASASATQPLSTFVEASHEQAYDAREQAVTAEQRSWEAQAALGRLLPSFNARGVLSHNQYEVQIPAGAIGNPDPITMQAKNQLQATFTLTVPLIDVAQAARYHQARHAAKAAEAQKDATFVDVDRAVAQAYYTYLGAEALVRAAQQSIDIAQENFELVKSRNSLGAATTLDLERARANVERSKRDLADAELIRITASRNLETLSGIAPEQVVEFPVDDLSPEAPLQSWLDVHDTPTDRVQDELNKSAKAAKRAAAYSLLPTLSANATETVTNAAGFTGRSNYYVIQGVLNWNLDYATYSTAQAQAKAAEVQKIRSEKIRRSLEDTIYQAYHRVESSITVSRSARAEAESAKKAADLALERYQAGALTQLEVTQSQRDAFQAQAARVKADADLAYARILLRVAAGKPAEVPDSVARSELVKAEPIQPSPNETTTPEATPPTDVPPATSAPSEAQ